MFFGWEMSKFVEVKKWRFDVWFSDDVMVMSDALEITAIQRVLDVLSDVSF